MMQTKRKGYAAVIWLILLAFFVFCPSRVSASETLGVHIYDGAGLLTDEESASLEQRCREIETRESIHVLMVTTEDTQGKSQQAYADDFYDEVYPKDSDENGVLVLIDMSERQLYVSTAGIMQYYLSDREIDTLLDHMYEEAAAADYAGAFQRSADDIELAIQRGISSADYLIDENGRIIRYRRITPFELAFAAASGVLVFCLVFFSVRHSYKKKVKTDARGYGRVSDVTLRKDRDMLVSRHVTSRKIPQGPPPGSGGPGGGSSVHTSSSGRSHGGGGRGF